MNTKLQVSVIMLGVRDVDRAKKFYAEGLGCDIEQDFPGFTDSRDAVDEVMRTAVAAGGTVVKEAVAAKWGGYSDYFSDPTATCGRSPPTPDTNGRDVPAGGDRQPGLDPGQGMPDIDVVQTGSCPDVRPLPADLETFLDADRLTARQGQLS